MEKYQPPYKDVHFRRLTFTAEEGMEGFRVGRVASRCNLAHLVFLESGKLSLVSAGRVQPTGILGTMVRRKQQRSVLEILVPRNGSEDGRTESLCARRTNQCARGAKKPKGTQSQSQGCPSVSMEVFICGYCRHNRRRFLRAFSTTMFSEGRALIF